MKKLKSLLLTLLIPMTVIILCLASELNASCVNQNTDLYCIDKGVGDRCYFDGHDNSSCCGPEVEVTH